MKINQREQPGHYITIMVSINTLADTYRMQMNSLLNMPTGARLDALNCAESIPIISEVKRMAFQDLKAGKFIGDTELTERLKLVLESFAE